MTENVHLVVALCGALVAIIGLMFAVAFALERVAQLRDQLRSTLDERDAAWGMLNTLGVRPLVKRAPPPKGGKL